MATTKQVTIISRYGIHCRPSAVIAKTAASFHNCNVKLIGENGDTSATDIMGILVLDLAPGSVVTVSTEGQDEEKVCEKMAELIGGEFDFEKSV